MSQEHGGRPGYDDEQYSILPDNPTTPALGRVILGLDNSHPAYRGSDTVADATYEQWCADGNMPAYQGDTGIFDPEAPLHG